MVKDLSHPSPHFPGSKRFRPPRIDLSRTVEKKIGSIIHIDPNSPVLRLEHDNSTFEETLQLSDSDTSDSELAGGGSSTHTVNVTSANDLLPDDISKDLAALQQLRQNVKKNLQLRPIRSRSNLPKVKIDINDDIQAAISKSLLTQGSIHDMNPPSSAFSPTSATSSYFTPIDYTPFSAIFPANGTKVDDLSVCTTDYSASPISPRILYERLLAPRRPLVIDTRPLAAHQSFNLKHSINIAIPSLILKRCRKPGGGLQSLDALRPFTTTEQATSRWDSLMCPGGPWDGDVIVYDDEMNPRDKDNLGITAWAIIPVIQPLLTHGSVFYLEGGFLNGGHHPDLQGLIMTGDEDKFETSNEIGSYQTRVDSHPPSEAKSGGSLANKRKVSLGLFQLDTNVATRSQRLPEIEPESTISTNPPSSHLRSPLLMPSTTSDSSDSSQNTSKTDASLSSLSISTATPSPPPSSVGFRKQQPSRRPSVPNLRRLDTKSAERLRDTPKLSVRTKPMRSATLSVPPPALSLNYLAPPHSPTHLNLRYSNHAPSPTPALLGGNNPFSPTKDPANYLTPYYTPPHTPRLPRLDEPPEPPRTPLTARPDMDPPTTDESCPMFTISTILPNFLFLGPELTTPEHVEELKGLGVKRILNIAAECDDDNGLNLRGVFEKYYKIPMRDTVEEDNITKGVREVCDILDDARLHSAPTYVHCKAGKSRSVTAVIAYLIHANHWTLSKAYSFVLERRKGISPNIGFVSELMNFEEQELGGKSIGVQPSLGSASLNSGTIPQKSGELNNTTTTGKGPKSDVSSGSNFGTDSFYGAPSFSGMNHLRRTGNHVRESLPSALGMEGAGIVTGPMSAVEGQNRVVLGDSGQETEVKDSNGRYRHARRAPVDENTLQPMRRVSKAGLESGLGHG